MEEIINEGGLSVAKPIKEITDFSPDVDKKRVYTKSCEINEWSFPNLCKQTEYRNQKLLVLAREIMPEI